MEFYAFKALLKKEGQLVSPHTNARWQRCEGTWRLEARPGDLQRGMGVYAAVWHEAARYGDQLYLVVPYLPIGQGGQADADFVLADEGWRSSAAAVVAGPWNGHEPMPREVAETIVAAHRQGYRQVSEVLEDAAAVLADDLEVDGVRADVVLDRALSQYGQERLSAEEAEQTALEISALDARLDVEDPVQAAVHKRATLACRALGHGLAGWTHAQRRDLAERMVPLGGLALAAAVIGEVYSTRAERATTLGALRYALSDLRDAYDWALAGGLGNEWTEPVREALTRLGDAAGDAPKEAEKLAALLEGTPQAREAFLEGLAAARLRALAEQPDFWSFQGAWAAAEELLAAVALFPDLRTSAWGRVDAVLTKLALFAAHASGEQRAALRTRLESQPELQAEFDERTAAALLHRIGSQRLALSCDNPAERLAQNIAVAQEYPLVRQKPLSLAWAANAEFLGTCIDQAGPDQLAQVEELLAQEPDLREPFEVGRAIATLEDARRRSGRDAAGVIALLGAVRQACQEHPGRLYDRRGSLWAVVCSTLLNAAGRAAALPQAGRAQVWAYVHHDALLEQEVAKAAEEDNPAAKAAEHAALLRLAGLNQAAYCGALASAVRRGRSGAEGEAYCPDAGQRAALLRQAAYLHDLPFVIAAGATWPWEEEDLGWSPAAAFGYARNGPWYHSPLKPYDFSTQPPAQSLPLLGLWPLARLDRYIVSVTASAVQPAEPCTRAGETVRKLAQGVLRAWLAQVPAGRPLPDFLAPAAEALAAG